jgi:hypothetical protein
LKLIRNKGKGEKNVEKLFKDLGNSGPNYTGSLPTNSAERILTVRVERLALCGIVTKMKLRTLDEKVEFFNALLFMTGLE